MQTLSIPVERLRPSSRNPRKTWDEDELADLVASIRAQGVLQPILARPLAGDGAFEVVAGHRRLKAAQEVGLESIPALVREMTDDEVDVAQITENLQRSDLGVFEEAEALLKLRQKGLALAEISAAVGKSEGYVVGRLDLLALPTKAKEAVGKGSLPLRVGLLIARLPDPKQRAEAATAILGESHLQVYRNALDFVRHRFLLALAKAPFPIAMANLVAGVGPCSTCPKRTGQQPDLFGELREREVCLDHVCYEAKAEAGWTLLEQEARKRAWTVMAPKDARKAFYDGGHLIGDHYVKVGDCCPLDHKERSWLASLGKDAPPIVLARDQAGQVHYLYARADAEAACRKKYPQVTRARRAADDKQRAKQKAQDAKVEHLREKSRALVAALVDKAARKTPTVEQWRVLVRLALDQSGQESRRGIVKRRGLDVKKGHDGLAKLVRETKEPGELLGLVLEALVPSYVPAWDPAIPPRLIETCGAWGVDPRTAGKEVKSPD